MLLLLLEFLVIALVFFFLGRYSTNQKEDIKAVSYKLKELKEKHRPEIGLISRPDAHKLKRIKEKGSKWAETEEAMEETFGKILKPANEKQK